MLLWDFYRTPQSNCTPYLIFVDQGKETFSTSKMVWTIQNIFALATLQLPSSLSICSNLLRDSIAQEWIKAGALVSGCKSSNTSITLPTVWTLYKLLNFPALYLPVSRDNNRIYLCRGVVKIRRANACAWPSPFKRHYPETRKMNHEFTVSLLRQGKAHQKKSCPSREKKLHVSGANSAELGSRPVIPDLRPGLFSGKSTHSLSVGSENPQRLCPQGAGL